MGLSIWTFIAVFSFTGCSYSLPWDDVPVRNFLSAFALVYIISIGLYCVVSSFVINRWWRKIVEEDMSQPADMVSLEQSSLSLRRMQKFLCYCIAIPFITIFPAMLCTKFVVEQYGYTWMNYFEMVYHSLAHASIFVPASYFLINVVFIPTFTIIPVLLIFCHVAKRLVKDEQSLITFPPKYSNLLQVLTGEEKPKKGLRFRNNVWGELLLIGVGFCMLQWLHSIVFIMSFVAYLLFAMFFAGIPRKRYFGYIYLGSFCASLHVITVFVAPGLYTPYWSGSHMLFGWILFWLVCFIATGVSGLWAFRRKGIEYGR